MRRHRKLLIGLGAGLMLGASVLELMNAAQPSSAWTEEQWLAQAERLGYQVFPAGEKVYTRDEVDRMVREAEARAAAAAGTGKQAGNGTSAKGEEDGRTLMMPITSGMTLQEAAEGLLVLGLLADRKDYEDFLRAARPYSGKIQPGIAVFRGRPTHEELIAELIRKKR